MTDPRLVRIELFIHPETARRYLYAGQRRHTPHETVSQAAIRIMTAELDDAAQFLPAQPPTPDAGWTEARRHESRLRNGGISAYTAAIPIIPKETKP